MHVNAIILQINETFRKNIGKMPPGRYVYHFNVLGPANESGSLTVFIDNNNVKENERVYDLAELSTELKYNFNTTSYESCIIVFLLSKGKEITLQLPVSPYLVQDVMEEPSMLLGLDDKILLKVDELESGGIFAENKNTNTDNRRCGLKTGADAASLREIEQFINARYFRGMLSTEESVQQLDYVVSHKLFAPDGSVGFTRFKRNIYRKLIKAAYHFIIRNRSRKLYFAKLYRNYVNSNILSENYHNQ